LYKFQGKTKSQHPSLDGHLFYLGKIEPTRSAKETVTIHIPREQPPGEIPLQVEFQEHNGFAPSPLETVIVLKGPPRPRFAYNYQIIDDGSGQSTGNGDGRVQKGEVVDLLVTLRNSGTVPAPNTWAEVSSEPSQNINLLHNTLRFGLLKPGETKQVRVNMALRPDFPFERFSLKLFIEEKTQNVFLNEQLQFDVDAKAPLEVVATNRLIRVTAESATLFGGAGSNASVIASVGRGQGLVVTGELGEWYRVRISGSEVGWISKTQVQVVATSNKELTSIPKIEGLEVAKAAQLITVRERFDGAASDRDKVEQALRQREREMEQLRLKLDSLSPVQPDTLSHTRQELEKERKERTQVERALHEQEVKAQQLRIQLDELSASQLAKLSSAEELLERERTQRAQAEQALRQHKAELEKLRTELNKLTDYSGGAALRKAAPAIALASPSDKQQISTPRVQIIGAAASDRGIARLEVRVNNELRVRRQGRGSGKSEGGRSKETTLEFSEWIDLPEGQNDITVAAFDHDQLASTRTVTVTRMSSTGKIWAVVIGISRYKTVRSLRYADRDAADFAEYLRSQVGVPKENVLILVNNDATLMNLKRTLGTELKRKANLKDTVIIFYAGHGAPEPDVSNLDGDGLEKYIVPHDADPNDLFATALPMRELETILERLSAERVILITDACYSGAAGGRTFLVASRRAEISDAFLTRLSKARGRVILTASRAGELSEERDDLGHGVFTHYLLKGLNGQADFDADGLVTVDEAYSYVSELVPEATGQNQHPVKKGEVEGQIVLGLVR
jgi:uncharacterized protein YgiM (DUF1202 family)